MIVETYDEPFLPMSPSDAARYRGTVSIGGSKHDFPSQGVLTDIYSTDSEPNGKILVHKTDSIALYL